MATALPPATKECLDGDAMEWLRDNGFIHVVSGVPDLTFPFGARQVWDQSMIRAHIYGPSGAIPRSAGGTYADNNLVNRGDLEAWAFDTAPPYPEPNEIPVNFTVGPKPPEDPDPNPANVLEWDNVSNPDVNEWVVQVFKNSVLYATVAAGGASAHRSYKDSTSGNHCYKLRYKHPDFNPTSNFTGQICRTAT